MICSMTAFGRTQVEMSGYSVTVEVRTLNSRNLDIVIRLPKQYSEFEDTVRKQVAQSTRRGRIEVAAQIESKDMEHRGTRVNIPAARFYWQQLQDLQRHLPGMDPPKLQHLLSIPQIFESAEPHADTDVLKSLLVTALSQTLQQIQEMRAQEGKALLLDLMERLSCIRSGLSCIEEKKDVILREYEKRLRDRIQEIMGATEPDENRILQEVACLAERSDINEEIVRLKSHLDQVNSLLTGPSLADGRRLDFLTQELHREVNTIGSKTGDLDIIQSVVNMKSEISKLKEQIQNVE